MLIYNITVNIDGAAHDLWLEWMRDRHIPDMLATGKFSHAKLARVLVEEELGGMTYSIQYTVQDRPTLEAYYREDAERLRGEAQRRFPNLFVAFRTELEVISQQIP